jgi:hypothetical protein
VSGSSVETPTPTVVADQVRRPRLWPGLIVPALTVVALIVTADYPDPDSVGGLGLITVIPWLVIGCALALSVSFALTLRAAYRSGSPGRLGALVLGVHVAMLLVVLHGIAALLQAEPRFSTAWYHVGFVDSIVVEQRPLEHVEARFSWPGFFSSVGAFLGAAGLSSAVPLLRFTPLVLNVAYLLPLALLVRTFVPSASGRWMAVWLFVLCNWVGQDYFSPQGVAYLLMLSLIAILTLAFSRRHEARRWWPSPSGGIGRWPWFEAVRTSIRIDADDSERSRVPSIELGVLILIIGVFGAMVMSHQLTPVVVVVDVVALVVLRRCTARLLPLALGVLLLGWVSYGAVDFWSGHLESLFGGSSAGGAVGENVSERLKGSTDHYTVILVRLGFALAVWLLAAVGAVRIVRAGARFPVAVLACALAPFPILAVQSYGGEAPLRIYLYTLPFMLIIGVRAFVTGPGSRFGWRACSLFVAAALIATPLFYVARFGNERFEQVRPGEIAAIEMLYRQVPAGATVVSLNGNVPWRYRDFMTRDYQALQDPTSVEMALEELQKYTSKSGQPVFVFVTKGQAAYAAEAGGLTTLVDDVAAKLRDSADFSVVYSNDDATLLRFEGAS